MVTVDTGGLLDGSAPDARAADGSLLDARDSALEPADAGPLLDGGLARLDDALLDAALAGDADGVDAPEADAPADAPSTPDAELDAS